jgi:hypothetical protein
MPLTGSQRTAYNQLLADAATLKASLNHIDPDQYAVKWIVSRFTDVYSERVKANKDKG